MVTVGHRVQQLAGKFVDIVISWSGSVSHKVALALREWLPLVLPGCKPWVSSEDIAKGKHWADELRAQLGKAAVAIVCVTPENVKSGWLYYEAGMIAAKLAKATVCPYLVKVPAKLVAGTPLALFQWTVADKAETRKLVLSLNALLPTPHAAGLVETGYAAKWQFLKKQLEAAARGAEAVEDAVTETEAPLHQRLSSEAKRILSTACEQENKYERGEVMVEYTSEGFRVMVGDVTLNDPDDARSVADYKGGLAELAQCGLVEGDGVDRVNNSVTVTRAEWQTFDALKLAVPENPQH